MIIYKSTVSEFLDISKDPNALVGRISYNLRNKFGISVGNSEQRSWMLSLPKVARLIQQKSDDKRIVLIEFNIPTSRQRIDFIILGKNSLGKPTAWILELKQWSDVTEEAWNEFRVGRYTDTHPSEQAQNYKERLENEMGMKGIVDIKSSAYLHNLRTTDSPLYKRDYSAFLTESELFSALDEIRLKGLLDEHTIITDGSESFELFKSAKWTPSKKFKEIIAHEFKNINLVGSQKEIFRKIEHFIKGYDQEEKMTFVISGDPGSGKTIIAFKLMLLIMEKLSMKLQLMIPGQELRDAYKYELRQKMSAAYISGSKVRYGYDAAIIDEAHKAIGRDTGVVNYNRMYNKLKFAIIFIDDDQVINRKGIKKDVVIKIAKEHGHNVKQYAIDENFRNKGERQLLDWIDHIFYGRKIRNREFTYSQEKYINETAEYKLRTYLNDDAFIRKYYEIRQEEDSTRLTSLWHEEFYVGNANPDGSIPKTVPIGKYKFIWNPNQEWFTKLNPLEKSTYSKSVKQFAKERRNFLMQNPNHDYIAYFNHIQGYEFDNIFVYIPDIFTYENGEITFHRDRLAKEVKVSQTWSPTSKAEALNGEDPNMLNKQYFLNRIKVMLTRGTKSTHIYAQDKALNKLIMDSVD